MTPKPILPSDTRDDSERSFVRPKRRSDIRTHTIEGETVVLDRREGMIHQFNKTASFIWELCDGTRNFDQLTQELCDAFEVDFKTAQRDVQSTIETLHRSRLLEIESVDR